MHDDLRLPSAGPRRGRRRADAPSGRDVLLTAARKVFGRKGFDGAGLRDIASAAGVDVALVARLFGSKSNLWQAVVDQLAETQSVHLKRVSALARDPALGAREALCQFIDLFALISWEMPEFFALLMQEVTNPGERLETLNRELVQPFEDAAIPIVKAAIASGALRATNPSLFLQMLFSSIAVPLLAPAMRDDLRAGSQLREALASEARRIYTS